MKNWLVASADRKAAEMLSAQCGLPPFIVYILMIRGFNTKESIMEFLSDDTGFENPFDAVDMDKAVERINRALDNYEKSGNSGSRRFLLYTIKGKRRLRNERRCGKKNT